jgi:hypothetical protein
MSSGEGSLSLPPPSPVRSEVSILSTGASSPVQGSRMVHPTTPTTPVHQESIARQPQSAPLPSSNTFGSAHAPQAVSERRLPPHGSPVDFTYRPQQPVFDDDETTEPSSAANTADNNANATTIGSIARFVEFTRQRLSFQRDSEEGRAFVDGAIICGYLQKLGRNGKWQTRWFETDGECLSYYKSNKRTKLLATLDLEKVRLACDCLQITIFLTLHSYARREFPPYIGW